MFYGRFINKDNYGFGVSKDLFETYVEIGDEEHMALVDKANNESKIIIPDKNGVPILAEQSEMPSNVTKQDTLLELEYYLVTTDWYIIRQIETGKPIPEDIKKKRQEAREEISRLRLQ